VLHVSVYILTILRHVNTRTYTERYGRNIRSTVYKRRGLMVFYIRLNKYGLLRISILFPIRNATTTILHKSI